MPYQACSTDRRLPAWRLALLLIALLAGGQGLAEAAPKTSGSISLDEVRRGMLLARIDDGSHRPLPAVDSHVRVRVSGTLARSVLRQRFRNPTNDWVEAIYAFPLPEDAAVDTLRLRIGERIVEGEIQEREQARRTYEVARDAGQRTALVEQQRPNLFTTAVANIPPGAEITVEIAYQHMLDWREGRFSLRVPMAITPRYAGGKASPGAEEAAAPDGWPLLPGELRNTATFGAAQNARSAVDLEVQLQPGFELAALRSHYHSVTREQTEGGMRIRLDPGATADRDFLLSWAPADSAAAQPAFFSETVDDQGYGLLMLMPPPPDSTHLPEAPRELIFVLDVSGSMAGLPMRAAKAALQRALDRLQARDRFNVVIFNHGNASLFPQAQAATPQVLARAKGWVDGLSADGGTELLGGLRRALATRGTETEALRQIVFITDGAISEHEALFRAMDAELGSDRLFTVGIGHAPNTHLLSEMAHFGRGTSTYIAAPEEVEARMGALFRQLEQPALTDLALSLPDGADVLPRKLPDLYAGEPLTVFMKLDALPASLTVEGLRGGTPWRRTLSLAEPTEQAGIGKAWAREKLRHWQRVEARGADRELVREASLTLALEHDLVSRFTSLVAVDKTPARVREALLERHDIARELPHGMNATEVGLAQTATPARLLLMLAAALLLLALALWLPSRRPA